MTLALLFPGQGVQHATMLSWLESDTAAAPALATLGRHIGSDWRRRLAEPAWAEQNGIAQCLVTGTSLAAFAALRAAGLPAPTLAAGYSVGELAAFSATGVFDTDVALELAVARAAAMDRSAAGHPGGLIAVSGAAPSTIEAACRRGSLEVAIRIAPDRCLLGGDNAMLLGATEELAALGADVTRLRIRTLSHTSRMHAAAAEFASHIDALVWRAPTSWLVTNLDGAAHRSEHDLKRCLAAQIDHTVQWQRCTETLAERRPGCVLEVGPGTSLSSLWMAAHPEIPSRSVDEFGSAASAVEWVRSRLTTR